MKRGKDDEKIMGPMFPRLHVNDTEKGGPRAPPRNKMALYEQLSIPSQRFNPAVLPPNPSKSTNFVPHVSSSQGSSLERNALLPHVSPTTPTLQARVNAPVAQLELRKKAGEEDDFTVPVFNTGMGQRHSKIQICVEGEKLAPETYTGRSVKLQNVTCKEPNRSSSSLVNLRKEAGEPGEERSKVCLSREYEIKTASNSSTGQKIDGPLRESEASPSPDCSRAGLQTKNNAFLDRVESVRDIDNGVLPLPRRESCTVEDRSSPDEPNNESECRGVEICGSLRLVNEDDDASETSMVDSISGVDISPDDVVGIIGQKHFWKARRLIAKAVNMALMEVRIYSMESRDSSSSGNPRARIYRSFLSWHSRAWSKRTSGRGLSLKLMLGGSRRRDWGMFDILIVGERGGKRIALCSIFLEFCIRGLQWVGQQRMFAVQVFELHRLIKVQRLIAGSPHLLLEERAYLGKPSFKGSAAKKLTSEYAVKPVLQITCKDDCEKPTHKLECSAENAVCRTSLSSVKNGSQPSSYGPCLGNTPPAPIPTTDNKTNPWSFHHSPGHQWLIPVMSPSEGLVYKPYPGSGFPGTVCGGCGPFGPSPMTGNFMTPAYGVQAPPHHQGMGFLHGAPPVGQVYFPPYGMPAMHPMSGSAMEQMNQFAQPGSHGHAGQLSGGGANFNTQQQQSSCNLPAQKNGGISHVVKSKDTELQGSTASSPSERVQQDCGITNNTEGRNGLSLFPTVPAAPGGTSLPHDTQQPTRVIRVVPHNPRSATESAARIFQSIQEERKQHDSD